MIILAVWKGCSIPHWELHRALKVCHTHCPSFQCLKSTTSWSCRMRQKPMSPADRSHRISDTVWHQCSQLNDFVAISLVLLRDGWSRRSEKKSHAAWSSYINWKIINHSRLISMTHNRISFVLKMYSKVKKKCANIWDQSFFYDLF